MSGDDELVLCHDAAPLDAVLAAPFTRWDFRDDPARFDASSSFSSSFFLDVLSRSRFRRRGDVENNPSYKQIIPYVMIRSINGYLAAERLTGDARLTGRVHIGHGGHLNPSDGVGTPGFLAGVHREIREEIGTPKIHNLEFVGWINDRSDDVGRVHLGVALRMDVSHFRAPPTGESKGWEWMNSLVLKHMKLGMLESWSQILVDEGEAR